MRFRPCIDIHNGKVKQIVGGSLTDVQDQAEENFVSEQDGAFYARLYREADLSGGHVILLNSQDSPYYEATRAQAFLALKAYPGGLQLGGGVNPQNAGVYLDAGASHVIVTSYVFRDGRISWEKLEEMEQAAGREHLVLDLSCRKKENSYYIVTDRWQKFTDVPVTLETMEELGEHCDEFLVHAVDVEGKAHGVETELAELLSGLNTGRRFYVNTTNALLGNVPGVQGMKTGFTNKAKYCFIGLSQSSKGHTYISVVLGGPTSAARWQDSRTLLNYAYLH